MRFLSCTALILLGVAVTGCGSDYEYRSAGAEFDEQVEAARENADERQEAHVRAVRIERTMHPQARSARKRLGDCELEYAPIKPRNGVVPIACGDLAAKWPLTVKRGYLRCEPSIRKNFERVIFSAPDGAEYAVNSSAHGVGYLGIDVIWKHDSHGRGIDIEPLREKGLELCSTKS
jgi:hypothetical protein